MSYEDGVKAVCGGRKFYRIYGGVSMGGAVKGAVSKSINRNGSNLI